MLTRLEIDGFKTFEKQVVDLAPFTAVVGSNAAGKSNLFDVIQLLSNLATRDVAEAVKDMRGEPLELFRQIPSGRSRQISLAAEVLVDPVVRDPWGSEVKVTHTRMRYEVTLEWRAIRPGVERIQVAREAVLPILRKDDRWAKAMCPTTAFRAKHLKYARSKPWLTTEERLEGLTFNIHQDGKSGRNRPASAAEATMLYSVTNAEFPHLFALREEMRHWRLLQLDPALLRRPVPVTASDVLNADGSNLAAVLAQLKAQTLSDTRPQGVLRDIAAELNQLIPGVMRLETQLHDASREYRIELTMRDGLPFTSRVISDGTLRVLALLTLLHDPRHRGLVCFEEPENGVHPARVKLLVQRLRDMVSSPGDFSDDDAASPLSQLLLNSHSPVVLSALIDKDLHPIDGAILFADTSSVSDPGSREIRRKTRLRPVRPRTQDELFDPAPAAQAFVSAFEVRTVLETATAEA
ncbi:AAA family ATPase [Candidatus Symbiobacter mobilis]|uniref:ATPase-like protein n=1 Tax=Candidatus Symbiobacter mobilis CR TaxID=946483 RepID=U5NAZ3_9BURK|nr:AAA family ATPase [Candidatus Symbiobacter mobilis]AGX88751.1 ATPase-like protein [Candidatus Symbiobacter mobilis CR]